MEWLVELGSKAVRLLPRWFVVGPSEMGLRLRCGKVSKKMGPGLYWLLPIIHDYERRVVVAQVIDVPDVSIKTKDGVSVVASGIVEYSIDDLEAALYRVLDYDEAIQLYGSACLAAQVGTLEWNHGIYDRKALENKLRDELRKLVSVWGIKVKRFVVNRLADTIGIDLTLHQASNRFYEESNAEG